MAGECVLVFFLSCLGSFSRQQAWFVFEWLPAYLPYLGRKWIIHFVMLCSLLGRPAGWLAGWLAGLSFSGDGGRSLVDILDFGAFPFLPCPF